MALASDDGSVRVRDLAIGTVLTELLASQRFHEGGGTVNLSAADTRLMCDLLRIFHAGGYVGEGNSILLRKRSHVHKARQRPARTSDATRKAA